MREELEKVIIYLKNELSKLRAGRASIDLVENIMVDAYGTQMPLNQLATLGVPEPRLITIQPWDRGLLKNIESALRHDLSDFNPIVDKEIIRISYPAPTEERRKELVKEIGKIVEEARIRIRRIREDALEELKRKEGKKEISEDELFRKKDESQKLIDEYNRKTGEVGEKKEEEIMTV